MKKLVFYFILSIPGIYIFITYLMVLINNPKSEFLIVGIVFCSLGILSALFCITAGILYLINKLRNTYDMFFLLSFILLLIVVPIFLFTIFVYVYAYMGYEWFPQQS